MLMEDLWPEETALTAQAPPKRRFSYSIASIGIFAALLTFLIAVGVLSFISFYFQDQLRRQYRHDPSAKQNSAFRLIVFLKYYSARPYRLA